jgi:hypothetical protein
MLFYRNIRLQNLSTELFAPGPRFEVTQHGLLTPGRRNVTTAFGNGRLNLKRFRESRVTVTSRLAVYCAKPLENHDQRFCFLQLNPCGHSPYVTSSLTRGWVCVLSTSLPFRRVYVSHIQHVIENSSLCTIYKSSVSTGFVEQIMHILRIFCYNGSLVA